MRKQQGMALISVLFITALVVAVITAIAHRQTLDIQLTSNTVFRSQAFFYAAGAEVFAQEMLFRDFKENDQGKLVDGPEDLWVVNGAALPVDDKGLIEVELYDLQSRFNLNNLIDANGKSIPLQLDQLKRLFTEVTTKHSDIDLELSTQFAESIVDWVDLNDTATGLGSEDGDYLVKNTPYRTANYLLQSTDELALIEGSGSKNIDILKKYVSALPEVGTPLNVNLASKEVLLSLDSTISASEVDQLILDREETPFATVQEFLNHQALTQAKGNLNASSFSVFSNYFLLKSRISFGDRAVQLYSVLWRDESNGKTRIISRDMSKRFIPVKPIL